MSFSISEQSPRDGIPRPEFHLGALDARMQEAILGDIRDVVAAAPLFHPVMPRTGKPFSVRMTNCGPLGWVSDRDGYRYQSFHPQTGGPWPPIPQSILGLWARFVPGAVMPEACLINFYGADAKMGLHQDRDEEKGALGIPVLSVSLGDDCVFRYGRTVRKGGTNAVTLRSGDILLLAGETRLAYHGVTGIHPGTSMLLKNGGRINLTLRRVTTPE